MMRRDEIELHGHTSSYRTGGSGPVLVLVHGITNSSASWEPVLDLLAEHFTIIAPDLLGHGDSAKPRGDYSLGASASLLRDLLLALGHERATIAGHSLGGGIAMQYAYQFPERVERLIPHRQRRPRPRRDTRAAGGRRCPAPSSSSPCSRHSRSSTPGRPSAGCSAGSACGSAPTSAR